MKKKKNKKAPSYNQRGPTWLGLYQRKTKTKKEKLESIENKYKKEVGEDI